MGNVRVRPETGKLYFDFNYRGVRCREQTALDDTQANRQLVAKTLKRMDAEMTLGTFEYAHYFPGSRLAKQFSSNVADASGEQPSFSTYADRWLKAFSVTWRENYRQTIVSQMERHLLPEFGHRVAAEITRDDVLTFRAELSKKKSGRRNGVLSPKTVNEIMGVLTAILNEVAVETGKPSPCNGIRRLKVQRQDIAPFDLGQVQSIIDNVRKDYRPYLTVRFFTGLRSGEANGLKWKHIDFSSRQILVRETYTHGRTEYTKTDGSQREVSMSEPVFQALLVQEKQSRHRSEYVFCNSRGGPIDNKNFCDRIWYPFLAYLGLEARRPYQMRHTAATLWLASGENPLWIARQLGHTSTEMLFRVYSRYVPNLTRQDGSAFERLLAANLNGVPTLAANDEPAAEKEGAHE